MLNLAKLCSAPWEHKYIFKPQGFEAKWLNLSIACVHVHTDHAFYLTMCRSLNRNFRHLVQHVYMLDTENPDSGLRKLPSVTETIDVIRLIFNLLWREHLKA